MNIFLLSDTNCPKESAIMSCDSHVRKMGIESCQLLANLFSVNDLSSPECPRTQKNTIRKYSHINHPCDVWLKKSYSNFEWLLSHTNHLFEEYTFRYKKKHFTETFFKWVLDNKDKVNIPNIGLTEFPLAINKDMNCRKIHNFESLPRYLQYRLFYIHDKPFAKWEKGRICPEWFKHEKTT